MKTFDLTCSAETFYEAGAAIAEVLRQMEHDAHVSTAFAVAGISESLAVASGAGGTVSIRCRFGKHCFTAEASEPPGSVSLHLCHDEGRKP